jgi:hypothetical protein
MLDRFRLVRIELLDSARLECCPEARIERMGKGREPREDCRQPSNGSDMEVRGVWPVDVAAADSLERRVQRAIAA